MITASIFSSIEFYVAAVLVAAAIVAFFAIPHSKGPARQELLGGTLSLDPDYAGGAAIEITVENDGTVTLVRHGLEGLTTTGAVSLALDIAGFDIEARERIMGSSVPGWDINTATFRLTFLGRTRYHLHYTNPDTGLMAATAINVRPGIHIIKELK